MQLYSPSPLSATHASASAKRQIRASGRNLKRLLDGKSPRERAWAGARLVTGEFAYVNPTVAQAARICCVTARQVHAALVRAPKPPSDTKLDRIVAQLGADRVLAALDRPTKPRCDATAEMF
jgi:hypothetical protein